MTLFAFIITSVKFQLKLISEKKIPYDFMQWTLYNTIYCML